MIDVAIGLIWRDGRLLITRRPPGTHLAGLWEFPGGKCRSGEDPAACIVREVAEELKIAITVDGQRTVIEHEYPDRAVRLFVFDCRWHEGEPEPYAGTEWRLVPQTELSDHDFPPANAPLLRELGIDAPHPS